MEAVLFDFNGTLIFDTPLHAFCWKEMAKRIRGTPLSDDEFQLLNGRTNKQLIEHILNKEISDEDAKKYAEEKENLYRTMLMKSDIKLCDGAINLFEALKKCNIPFTIATSSDWGNVQVFIQKYHLDEWFDIDKIIFNDFTFKGKPAPDIYLKASKKLGVNISHCIVFEDTISGIHSALSAGATPIGIASEMTVNELLQIKGCNLAIHTFNEITIEEMVDLIKNK
ncbi:hypothetical protein ENUP19_0085G0120 [Entamoeba nuttalli]|uniref:HAD hydrolase, family IA, variant 3, putative n=2 Tax=Entamoeba nuttalli TaxID=412467 RepID=K2G4M8_ENTNP|nr:HAD hydrolase, family IA, variant 3, putative [Entamoeba nuttalli P19]EKE37241.1 HAD hydrolase, family IA, variant 3, putative [Entamoeba nuttalli P19]|eukprot:XP_008860424.1 HAD hydrolase, family IA, variant 3, putative [Entamoeba nuttalli P19]